MSDVFEPRLRRRLVLREGKERALANRHPWIFSGAIAREDGPEDAAVADLFDRSGTLLASGFHSRHSQIRLRVMTFGEPFEKSVLIERIRAALAFRRSVTPESTDLLRLIHAEGDRLGGLIVDRYGDLLVVEITSAGLEQVRDTVLEVLQDEERPRGVLIANDGPARRIERLSAESVVIGDFPDEIIAREYGLSFVIEPRKGQKTGFFIDQRENRRFLCSIAADRDILNLFSYSGGFGVYAVAGGARTVEEVDISQRAINLARRNHEMNAGGSAVTFKVADAFEYVRTLGSEGRRFDVVICDPPAFARSRRDVDKAARGYKDVNLHALRLIRPGGYLLAFSCSGHIDADLFQKIIFAAAVDAGREVAIVGRMGAGMDHPVSIYCPESEYLKGLVLRVGGRG
jgi:23S rRNA (cytosine1962-C5)-methyltransferase